MAEIIRKQRQIRHKTVIFHGSPPIAHIFILQVYRKVVNRISSTRQDINKLVGLVMVVVRVFIYYCRKI